MFVVLLLFSRLYCQLMYLWFTRANHKRTKRPNLLNPNSISLSNYFINNHRANCKLIVWYALNTEEKDTQRCHLFSIRVGLSYSMTGYLRERVVSLLGWLNYVNASTVDSLSCFLLRFSCRYMQLSVKYCQWIIYKFVFKTVFCITVNCNVTYHLNHNVNLLYSICSR